MSQSTFLSKEREMEKNFGSGHLVLFEVKSDPVTGPVWPRGWAEV